MKKILPKLSILLKLSLLFNLTRSGIFDAMEHLNMEKPLNYNRVTGTAYSSYFYEQYSATHCTARLFKSNKAADINMFQSWIIRIRALLIDSGFSVNEKAMIIFTRIAIAKDWGHVIKILKENDTERTGYIDLTVGVLVEQVRIVSEEVKKKTWGQRFMTAFCGSTASLPVAESMEVKNPITVQINFLKEKEYVEVTVKKKVRSDLVTTRTGLPQVERDISSMRRRAMVPTGTTDSARERRVAIVIRSPRLGPNGRSSVDSTASLRPACEENIGSMRSTESTGSTADLYFPSEIAHRESIASTSDGVPSTELTATGSIRAVIDFMRAYAAIGGSEQPTIATE